MTVLPQPDGPLFLTDGGIETDLIFRRGIDLPEFAAFVLHGDARGEAVLRDYYADYFAMAEATGCGLVLDTATWRASSAWGAKTGYDDHQLRAINERAVAFLFALRSEQSDGAVVVSGCVGPRGDAYADLGPASVDEALAYHRLQVEVLAGAGAEVITALTLTNVGEAIGVVRAGGEQSIPTVVSFTVETDGRLPSGMNLAEAIATVDAETDGTAAYFMVNCAHHDHFREALGGDEPSIPRVRGVRANASRLSHAELDESTELDDGDPDEFGSQLAALRAANSAINVLGGCCGADARHIAAIARSAAPSSTW